MSNNLRKKTKSVIWAEKRERIKKAKKNLFLMASLQVFDEKGYNKTRIMDIAERAGTSVGGFYFYYKNKEELLEGVYWKYFELFMGRLKRVSTKPDPSISDLRKLLKDYAMMFRKRKHFNMIFLEQLGGINKKFAKMKNTFIDEWCKEFETIILKLQGDKKSQNNDTVKLSRMWVGTLLELVHWWCLTGFRENVDMLVESAINFGLNGILGP